MRKIRTIGILALALLAGGCASTAATQDADATTVSDPLEGMNRFFFDLNQRLDRDAGKPAATAYRENVPQSVRGGLHNVLDNLGGPVNVANDLLEAQLDECRHRGRDASWSTPPSASPASSMLPPTGACPTGIATLARRWAPMACRPVPYLVLPLRGSTDVRDFAGNYVDGFATPLHFVRYDGSKYVGWMKSTLGSMDNRSAKIVTYAGHRTVQRGLLRRHAHPLSGAPGPAGRRPHCAHGRTARLLDQVGF